jgi:predicted PurR-regulated permease PerM
MTKTGAFMNSNFKPDQELERRISARLLDVLIRAGMLLTLVVLCYQIFSPFVSLMAWALILAVTLYPLHRKMAGRMGNKQGLAATVLVLIAIVLIVAPTAVLMGSLVDSAARLMETAQSSHFEVPAPNASVETWPIVGKKLYALWLKAHTDLPAVLAGIQPEIIAFAKTIAGYLASTGGGILKFMASFIVAGVIMAYGSNGHQASRAIFARIAGYPRGEQFVALSTATIRAVAQGVIGVAFIQAIVIGLSLLVADIPWAGALALVVLVLGIAQIPAVLVTLPAIAYIWIGSDHGTVAAVTYTVLLFIAGMADNVLKPLLLGRGVDAPMPVILLGALGGMASAGILGMFVGAVLLALGYQIFMQWVHNNPDSESD